MTNPKNPNNWYDDDEENDDELGDLDEDALYEDDEDDEDEDEDDEDDEDDENDDMLSGLFSKKF